MIGRGDRSIVLNNRIVEEVEEISYTVVKDVFQIEEELANVVGDFSRVVPPKDVINWTTIVVVS